MSRPLVAFLCAFTVVGCGGADVLPEPEPIPLAIAAAAGDGQSAYTGQAVAVAPAVRVTKSGYPVQGVRVVFAVGAGGGAGGGQAVTGADGIASIHRWELGPGAGVNELVATIVGGNEASVTLRATAIVPIAERMLPVIDPAGLAGGTVGVVSPRAFVARATTVDGYPVAGVPVAWEVDAGGAVITAESMTDRDGYARATHVRFGTLPGLHRVTARTSQGGVSPTEVGWDVRVVPGPASQVRILAGEGQVLKPRGFLQTAFLLEFRDNFGNLLAGTQVLDAQVIEGGGFLRPENRYEVVDGRASVCCWFMGPSPGRNVVRVSLGSVLIDLEATAI